jgi:hypothetical protein
LTDYYTALRVYGDCLISLSLLDQIREPAHELIVLGTPVTQQVATLTGLTRHAIRHVLPRAAAFYDVKVQGPARALADLHAVRRQLAAMLRAGDRVLVEQRDWRNGLLAPGGLAAIQQPGKGASIYVDRAALLERVFGMPVRLPTCRRPGPGGTTLLINPGARQAFRTLPRPVIEHVLAYARARELRVCLLDPHGLHGDLAPGVAHYEAQPSLERAVTLLREHDLYVGADSFFLHLALHFGVPLFALTPWTSFYFAPPGLYERDAHLTLEAARDRGALFQALDRFRTPAPDAADEPAAAAAHAKN